jgi:hypothetical protein
VGLRKFLTGIALACSLYACDSESDIPDLGVELVAFEREDGTQTTKHHFYFDVVNYSATAITVPFDVQATHHFYNNGKEFDSLNVHNVDSPFGPYARESIYVVLENDKVLNPNCQDLSILVDGSDVVEESNEHNNIYFVD